MTALDFDTSLAVVIGINQYGNGIAPLRTAVADARAIAQTLQQEHDYDVVLLLDEQANASELKRLIQQQLPSVVTPNSRLLFYFAGHGIAQDGDDGPEGYLIPQDAMPGKAHSYLPMVELHDELTALPCRHFLAIFDCCFAGAFRWSSTRDIDFVPDVIHQERYDRFRQDPAWQVITSASYDQKAMDVLALQDDRGELVGQHSPFAAALLKALQGEADVFPPARGDQPAGDGVITATELYLYLRDSVEVLAVGQRKRQTPELCPLRNHDKGEFIFLTPGHVLNLPPAPELNKESNPYRGLESFEQAHRDLFFGREREIEQLLARLDSPHPLTVVLGGSGTGKSSLVKAGLLPRLADRAEFQILPVMRPGNRAVRALSRCCAELVPADEVKGLIRRLAKDESALVDIVGRWRQSHPDTKLLLVIDQTEELITQATSPAEAFQFQQLIKRVMAEHWECLWIIATLRSDFEAQFQDEALREAWMDARFVIPPMSQIQLRQAIENPAAARVMYFEPSSLVDTLLEDVAQTPGALPLLSFALSEMYLRYLERRSDNRALTEADYRALGGVAGALTQRATQEYENLVAQDEAYAQSVKHVMLRMVALEGGELARRRVPLSELVYESAAENSRVKVVLNQLITARLVVRGQEGEEAEPYVEPAHDALVRGWDKLLRWKYEEQEGLALQRRLSPAAKEWRTQADKKADKKRAQGLLWNDNPRLGLLREVLLSSQNWLNQVESAFVDASFKLKRQKQIRAVGSLVGVIAALSGLSLGLTTINAQLKASGKRAFARRLAARAETMVDKSSINQTTGALLAVRAHSLLDELGEDSRAVNQVLRKSLAVLPVTQTFAGGGNVKAIAFSPDGNRIATASDDGALNLWDAGSGEGDLEKAESDKNVFDLNPDKQVTAIAVSPNGSQVATVRKDKTAQIWDAATGKQAATLRHNHPVQFVRFSPSRRSSAKGSNNTPKNSPENSQWIATASQDQVKIWETATAKKVLTLVSANTKVRDVQFSPDGRRVAILRDEGKVSVWALSTGQKILAINHTSNISTMTFNPTSTHLALAAADGTATVFDIATGRDSVPLSHKGPVTDVRFSPDGAKIATASVDQTVRLWAATTGNMLTQFDHEDAVKTVTFSPDGTHLATTSLSKAAHVWDIATGQTTDTLSHDSLVNRVIFSPDGARIATASVDATTKLWDTTPTEDARRLVHEGAVRGATFSPNDGEWVATGSNDGTVKLWNPGTGEISQTLSHPEGVRTMSVGPKGRRIVTASEDNVARVWDVKTGKVLHSLKHEGTLLSVSFSPDGKQIATASADNYARIWDVTGKSARDPVATLKHDDVVRSANFNADGSLLVTASQDKKARIWDVASESAITVLEHRDRVHEAVFSPDGQYLATASHNTGADLWDVATGKRVVTADDLVFRLNHNDKVLTVRFSPNGDQVVTGSRDRTAKIWDIEKREVMASLNHRRSVNSVSFSAEGDRLVTASADGTALVWNAETGQSIVGLNHTAGVMAASFSPNGSLMATASKDGSAKVGGTNSEEIARRVCQRIGSNPTADDWALYMAPGAKNKARALETYETVCENYPVHPSVLNFAKNTAAEGSLGAAISIFRRVLKIAKSTDLDPLTTVLDQSPKTVAGRFYATYLMRLADDEEIYGGDSQRAAQLRRRARRYDPDVDKDSIARNEVGDLDADTFCGEAFYDTEFCTRENGPTGEIDVTTASVESLPPAQPPAQPREQPPAQPREQP
ncbi:MAG: caspase family protein, partial [Cyanobacteria bacterium J06559_3]